MTSKTPLLHVVLYQPDIPQNTGNIGRTCVAVGAKLWLVRPLGFFLDAKHLRRAGMDYWPLLDWEAVENWTELTEKLAEQGDVLVLGSESKGLPVSLLSENPGQVIKLPMLSTVRSLNLASTANTVVYEAIRQFGGLPGAM
jgi:tRNA (cytidine/uridine-2'-O-)-methyltransferase